LRRTLSGRRLLPPDLDERQPQPSQYLHEDADADELIEDREDLQPAVLEYQIRVRDARTETRLKRAAT